MTIHRVGPLPNTEPSRQQLGRVLVTIDDLDALLVILRQEATDADTVHVQFTGGYFTEPEDLRQLSDSEIVSLKVHSDAAEVNLEPTQAVAVGQPATTAKIHNIWARTRQTRHGTGPSVATWSAVGIASVLLLCVPVLLALFDVLPYYRAGDGGLTAVGLLFAIGFTYRMVRATRNRPGAIIEPMSLHEFRQLNSNNQYPRAAWIVAIISALIAVVAIAASFMVPIVTGG